MRNGLTSDRGALWCIVLAAGGSRRLGRPKQLVRYRGRPLLLRAAEVANRLLPGRVLIVLGADALRLRGVLRRSRLRARVVENRAWESGMSGSLRLGLAELPAAASAALILLVDQPRVSPSSLARLVGRWRTRPGVAAAASYSRDNRAALPGAPAILPRSSWRRIRALEGDTGARAVLRRLDRLIEVPIPDAAFDVDTAEDLQRLAER